MTSKKSLFPAIAVAVMACAILCRVFSFEFGLEIGFVMNYDFAALKSFFSFEFLAALLLLAYYTKAVQESELKQYVPLTVCALLAGHYLVRCITLFSPTERWGDVALALISLPTLIMFALSTYMLIKYKKAKSFLPVAAFLGMGVAALSLLIEAIRIALSGYFMFSSLTGLLAPLGALLFYLSLSGLTTDY